MNLQTRLVIKNYKLLEREALLKASLQNQSLTQSKPVGFLMMLVLPFGAGFLTQRLSQTMSGAELIRIATPVASLLLRI